MIYNGLYVDKPRVRSTQVTQVVIPTAGTIAVIGASAKRVRLHFVGDGATLAFVGQQNPVASGRLIPLASGHPQVILDVEDVGTMLQSAWFASGSGVASNLAAIETLEE